MSARARKRQRRLNARRQAVRAEMAAKVCFIILVHLSCIKFCLN